MINKILVLYVFHEFNWRVTHFIENAIFKDENTDFIFIVNNTQNIKQIKSQIPSFVKIMFRNNIGFDFGGWSEALLTDNLYQNYSNFIFVNSSVIGPFIKKYANPKWTEHYLNGLKDNVKLFGSTINTNGPISILHNTPHVQSYIFAMDKITLQYLIDCDIFSLSNNASDFHSAIMQKELLMSKKIIDNGWNIGCLMSQYKNVDFTSNDMVYKSKYMGDMMYDCYRGSIWDEYDLIFIKGNRITL
jgi:hypothetical protein